MNGLRFQGFVIDPVRRQVKWGEQPVPLSGKAFDLLFYMACHPGRPLLKDDLLKAVWPDAIVEESNLTYHVYKLRKVLAAFGDGDEDLIVTLPGRGYQFAVLVLPVPLATPGLPAYAPVVASAGVAAPPGNYPEEAEPVSPPPTVPLLSAEERLRTGFRRFGLRAILLSSAAVVAVSVFVLVLLTHRSQRHILNVVRLTNDGLPKHFLGSKNGIFTDGSLLFFTERQENRSMLAEVPIEGGDVRSRPAPFTDAVVADYSKVNHSLLLSSVWRTDDESPILAQTLSGSKAMQVGELSGHDASWSPDARSIAVAKGRFLYVADADGSNVRRLVSASGIVFAPRWSPDGRALNFTEHTGSNEDHIWEIDADGGNLHRLLTGVVNEDQACCGVWSADGHNFFYATGGISSSSIWVLPSGQEHFFFQKPQPTLLTVGGVDFWNTPLPSKDGRTLWSIGSNLRGELMAFNATTRQLQPFLGGLSAEGVSFSPDRSRIVYTAYPEGTLWQSRPDGSEKHQLSKRPWIARFPQWSPDGRTVAFLAGKPGSQWQIYLVPADGDRQPYRMLDESAAEGYPNWSPNGKEIAFGRLLDYSSEHDPNLTIELYDLERHSRRTLHGSEGMWTARWSPDGRFLSAVTQDNRVLRLCDMKTQQWTDLANVGVADVIWSRDSRYIYFDTFFGGDAALYRISMDTRKLERWADLRGVRRGGFFGSWLGITPDGLPLLLKDTSIEEIYRLELSPPS